MSTNRKKLIPNVVLILVIVVGICWVASRFIHLGRVEYTNNAQVKQHITPINTRVQGFIKKIYFEEYQRVRKGDTLVVIEDAEYCLRLAQAEADYRNALVGMDAMHTTVHAAQSNVLVTDAGIEEVRVRLANAEKDYERYKELLKQEAVTVQQFDQVKTEFEATKARYEQILRQRQAGFTGETGADAAFGTERGEYQACRGCIEFGSTESFVHGDSGHDRWGDRAQEYTRGGTRATGADDG